MNYIPRREVRREQHIVLARVGSMGAATAFWNNVHLGEETFGHMLYLHLLLKERSKSPKLRQRLQPNARSCREVCAGHCSCSFSSLTVLAPLQAQQATCSHVNRSACLLSPVLYSPLNAQQICIDFRTTRAVNYRPRLAWPVPR